MTLKQALKIKPGQRVFVNASVTQLTGHAIPLYHAKKMSKQYGEVKYVEPDIHAGIWLADKSDWWCVPIQYLLSLRKGVRRGL